jgi:hypothetical protein
MAMDKKEINDFLDDSYLNKRYLEGIDIHIDMIYPRIKKEDWIKKSIKISNYIYKEKLRKDIPLILILSIYLKNRFIEKIKLINNINDIKSNYLNQTPPSFYLIDEYDYEQLLMKPKINLNIDLKMNTKSFLYQNYRSDDRCYDLYLDIIFE